MPAKKDFLSRVLVTGEDDCWEWQGGKTKNGYGVLFTGGRDELGRRNRMLAHRFSFKFYNGFLPEGKLVCHTCDNRPCVNPKHLFLGTYLDNNRDMMAKGRFVVGEKHYAAKLTENNVREIKQNLLGKQTQEEIARRFGVTREAISRISQGKNWKQVGIE